ncbi:MAG: phage portal protein [Caulobacteraceae bacterium]|nr:phage portal protein [Caulobacteraceae bacterium]
MTLWSRIMSLFSSRASVAQSFRDPALTLYFGGSTSHAGVLVSPEAALNYGPFWQAVRLISETIGSLPIHVYRRLGSTRVVADDVWIADLLRIAPNPEMGAMDFRSTILAHALVYGNGYAEIERDTLGRPVRLWLLDPAAISVQRVNESLVYAMSTGGRRILMPADDVLHLRGPSQDGIVGLSVVQLARQAIGLGLAAEQYGSSFFGQGARPSGVLEHPGRLSDDARIRLRGDWERLHSGVDNAHRVAILEEGMKWSTTSLPPDDAQFLQTRKFQIEEIARWFSLPLSKLRSSESSSYNSLEQENQAFLTETLRPWLIRIEQEIRLKLIDDPTLHVEHRVEGLLRTDISARYGAYAIGRQWGWLSVNEIRSLEGLDPVDGGDIYLSPLNMTPINANTQQAPEAQSTTAPLSPSVDVAATALNGAQVTSLLEIVTQASQGLITIDTAKALVGAAFPTLSQQTIDAIFGRMVIQSPDADQTRALYDSIDFTPPQGVRDEAARGLEWRRQYGRGGTEVGVARARDLANGRSVSPETIARMVSYFARHEVDKEAEGWSPGEDGYPSAGRIAWALWGGDPGRTWALYLSSRMQSEQEAST